MKGATIIQLFCVTAICLLSLRTVAARSEEATISRSESFNHQGSDLAKNAHDGRSNTFYTVKDNEVDGNFLKLFLSKEYKIGKVMIQSNAGAEFAERILNTEVKVFKTNGGEKEVASCGQIIEKAKGNPSTIIGRTYYLNCQGKVGDMVYITDLDVTAPKGHSISRVVVEAELDDCSKPTVKDGKVSPGDATISSGDSYTITCNSGYGIFAMGSFESGSGGTKEVTCTDGQLSTLPDCEPVDCNKPNIENGKVKPDEATISSGSNYEITCNDGFVISGASKITCTAGALSEEPTCEAKMSSASSFTINAALLVALTALLLIGV